MWISISYSPRPHNSVVLVERGAALDLELTTVKALTTGAITLPRVPDKPWKLPVVVYGVLAATWAGIADKVVLLALPSLLIGCPWRIWFSRWNGGREENIVTLTTLP